MSLLSFIRKRYQPLNIVKISQDNLVGNYRYLVEVTNQKRLLLYPRQLAEVNGVAHNNRKNSSGLTSVSQAVNRFQIAPVLKSNAYGHGIIQVAQILDSLGAPFFCVDSIYEGYQLLKAKIKTPILIMGYIQPENLQVKKLPFLYAVSTDEMLDAIKKYQPHAKIHIFVDTGMHREGLPLKNLSGFLQKIKEYNIEVEGFMSHFAMADKSKDKQTKGQVVNFIKAKKIVSEFGIQPKYFHIQASSGIVHAKEYPKDLGNCGRVGIALFGIDPERKNKNLKPVLQLASTIVQIKEIKKGEKLGYDFSFTAKKNMQIAILPIGYNDGVNRELSNKGFVKIGETFCPIVGRVSMNITIVDISKAPPAQIRDEVIIFSSTPGDKNSITNVAKLCEVIPYEILVQLHASTKRVVV